MSAQIPGLYSSVKEEGKPITKPEKPISILDKLKQNLDTPKLIGAAKPAYTEPVKAPERGVTKPVPKPIEQAKITRIPRVLKQGMYARNTGIKDSNGNSYINAEDAELLNKLGFSVNPNEYSFLAIGDVKEDTYSYIEKAAGISKSVVEAIDKDQAFSAEYLKELDYKVPDSYEVKGDLVVPLEKEAGERVRVVLPYKDQYLLEKLMNSKWPDNYGKRRFPGGGIDLNETPAQAASREFMEELGINVAPDKFEYMGLDADSKQHYLKLVEHGLNPGKYKANVGSDPYIYLEQGLPEGLDYLGANISKFNKPIEKKAAADPSQTILITGHSGSGKSTLGKLLAEKLNLPLHRVDAQQSWDDLRASMEASPDYERKALTSGTIENRKYIQDLRKIVGKSLNEIEGPAILEGTQVTTLPPKQLAKYRANILVGGDVEQSIAQRLQRMIDKANKKNITFSPEELDKKRLESELVANSWKPGMEKFKQLPGVLKYNHTEDKPELLIDRLRELMSKKANWNYNQLAGLDERAKVDQQMRENSNVSPEQIKHIQDTDSKHTNWLQNQVYRSGLPSDQQAAGNTWLVAQHADIDPQAQEWLLNKMRKHNQANTASPYTNRNIAYLDDRVNVNKGKPQLYGTQGTQSWDSKNNSWAWTPRPIQDSTNLDNRRKQMGLEPHADYMKGFKPLLQQLPPPANQQTKPQLYGTQRNAPPLYSPGIPNPKLKDRDYNSPTQAQVWDYILGLNPEGTPSKIINTLAGQRGKNQNIYPRTNIFRSTLPNVRTMAPQLNIPGVNPQNNINLTTNIAPITTGGSNSTAAK